MDAESCFIFTVWWFLLLRTKEAPKGPLHPHRSDCALVISFRWKKRSAQDHTAVNESTQGEYRMLSRP